MVDQIRPDDSILQQIGPGRNTLHPQVNLSRGGVFGYSADIAEFAPAQAYTRNNVVALLLRAPKFFDLMPDGDVWKRMLKDLIETQAKTIEGLKRGIEGEFEEHDYGQAGEKAEEPVKTRRQRSEVEFTWPEKYGRSVSSFWEQYLIWGILDPDTGIPMVATLGGQRPADWLPDNYTFSCLFFEPDLLWRYPLAAWIGVGMMPKKSGDWDGKRAPTENKELVSHTIPFTGVYNSGFGAMALAEKLMKEISLEGAVPFLRSSFLTEVEPAVQNAQGGYSGNISSLAGSATPPPVTGP